MRVRRNLLLKQGELERAIELAARQTEHDGGILVLLDADDDCPKELGADLLKRAVGQRSDRRIRVVLAKSEFETWFLAAAPSISGHRGLPADLARPPDPELIRDAKRWLSARITTGRAYRPTIDQPALTAVFDLDAARSAPSFDKLWREMESLL